MSKFIGYKNELWKVIHEFTCTGTDQPFTLDSGTYLFICQGGSGGVSDISTQYTIRPKGGISYGIIDLNEQTTFHAVVGGNGEDSPPNGDARPGAGGFNGGSPGGNPYNSDYTNYRGGNGGGGASDIRLLAYDPDEYPIYGSDGSFILPAAFLNQIELLYDTEYDPTQPALRDEHTYRRVEYLQRFGFWNRDGSVNSSAYYPYFNTNYVPTVNTEVVYDGVVFAKTDTAQWSCLFGGRDASNGSTTLTETNAFEFYTKCGSSNEGIVGYCHNNGTLKMSDGITFPFNQRMKLRCYRDTAEWSIGDTVHGSITMDDMTEPGTTPTNAIHLWCQHTGTSTSASSYKDGSSTSRLYGFKIYEVDPDTNEKTLMMNLIPCERLSDSQLGLFDDISKTFNAGVRVSYTSVMRGEYVRPHPSIDSRIMVAGGAGGEINIGGNTSTVYYSNCGGGGVEGGRIDTLYNSNTLNYRRYEPFYYYYRANQTVGYAKAYAMTPNVRPSSTTNTGNGAGGAGGGWYSGYSCAGSASTTGLSMSGSGGSGYVYTASSYKPEGYNPPAKYQFRDIFMSQSQSSDGKIIIAKLDNSYEANDTIEFPCVGEKCSVHLYPGEYTLKCYGGDGGYRYDPKNVARGGYSEGVLTLDKSHDVYVFVGGSGYPHWNFGGLFHNDTHANAIINTPAISWNGGGTPNKSDDLKCTSAGGSTDMRIDGDTLYHRFIVAGGAGSEGTTSTTGMRPTAGGGETGGDRINYASSRGQNNGPGTQTESPSDVNPDVAGSFGQGGPSISGNYTIPGAGGGGWYGGSGTYRSSETGSDINNGGCGGSGYVLTENSYKPEGYQVPSSLYLKNAITTLGGNNLEWFETKAVIEVINRTTSSMIAHDEEGYKHYDNSSDQWVLINPQPTQLTEDIFLQYIDSSFKNDNGLLNEYSIYVYDGNDAITSLKLECTIDETEISASTSMTSEKISYNLDAEYDPSIYQPIVTFEPEFGGTIAHVNIKRISDNEGQFVLYNMSLMSEGSSKKQSYHYYSAEELTPTFVADEPDNPCNGTIVKPRGKMEDYRDPSTGKIKTAQWLLQTKVGGSKTIPVEYLTGLFSDGTTDIYTVTCTTHNRTIYTCSSITYNTTKYLEFRAFNPITKRFKLLMRKEWGLFAPGITSDGGVTCVGLLVDDNFFYVTLYTSSYPNTYMSRLCRINRTDGDITFINVSSSDSQNSFRYTYHNSLRWANEEHTKICFISKENVQLFDTTDTTFTSIPLSDVYQENINKICAFDVIGTKFVSTYVDASSPQMFRLVSYDLSTNQRVYDVNFGTKDGIGQIDFCYHANKLYVVTCMNLRIINFNTGVIIKTYDISWDSNNKGIGPVVYVNGSVCVMSPQTHFVYFFNLKKEMLDSVYMPWVIPQNEGNEGKSFRDATTYNDQVFFPGGPTVAWINYMGDLKYNIGYIYNQYRIDYNEYNSEGLSYDENFVILTDSCAIIDKGYITYDVDEYVSHVTHVDISKSDYRKMYNVIVVRDET